MPLNTINQSSTGHFTIGHSNDPLGYLYWKICWGRDRGVYEHSAKIQTPIQTDSTYHTNNQTHHFENGTYTHSKVSGTSLLKKIKMPKGVELVLPISMGEAYNIISKRNGKSISLVSSMEGGELAHELNKKFNPLSIKVKNFSLPQHIQRAFLDMDEKDTEIVKTVIGDYL